MEQSKKGWLRIHAPPTLQLSPRSSGKTLEVHSFHLGAAEWPSRHGSYFCRRQKARHTRPSLIPRTAREEDRRRSHAQPYLSDHFLFLHKPKRAGVEERGGKSLPPGGAVAKPARLFALRPVSEWQPREGGGVPLDRDSLAFLSLVFLPFFSLPLRLSPARLLRSSLPSLSQMAERSSTPECLR